METEASHWGRGSASLSCPPQTLQGAVGSGVGGKMDMVKMGLKNLTQGNKPWAAGPLGHRSTRVPCLRTMDYQTFWPLQRERRGLHND